VVTGCYASLEPERAAALTGVDLVVDNRDKDALVRRIEEAIDLHAMPALASEADGAHAYREARTRAFVKVQDGCRNRCTFCIVTVARGAERSRTIDQVVAEVNELVARGHREVVLTGVHLGGYGSDLGTDLFQLVQAVLADTDVPRLRLSSLEPWDLPPRFGDLWRNRRLMPHLHLPLQSGSDAVLRRMARRSSTSEYTALTGRLRAAIPDLVLTTDVIVGFPGETEAQWRETLEFVERTGFAHVHIFTYSRREGTAAARMTGHLAPEVQRQRSRELHAVARRMKSEQLRRHIGQCREVLWEGPGEPTADGARRYSGYTDNYLPVRITVPSRTELDNQLRTVQLVRLSPTEDALEARAASTDRNFPQ
jgi:threonylcarbamoyladenosine tRNA methylthiotransferase MtaB